MEKKPEVKHVNEREKMELKKYCVERACECYSQMSSGQFIQLPGNVVNLAKQIEAYLTGNEEPLKLEIIKGLLGK